MGYEGHLMTADPATKAERVAASMALLTAAHADVGGEVVSGGGTGTYAVNQCVHRDPGRLVRPHGQPATAPPTSRSSRRCTCSRRSCRCNRQGGWAVLDGGLKALGMDHGNPTVDGGEVWFCSDEHTTYSPADGSPLPKVGDRVTMVPAHVDPTVAYHERFHVVSGDEVVDIWPIDLRGW